MLQELLLHHLNGQWQATDSTVMVLSLVLVPTVAIGLALLIIQFRTASLFMAVVLTLILIIEHVDTLVDALRIDISISSELTL